MLNRHCLGSAPAGNGRAEASAVLKIKNRKSKIEHGFSLVEVLVAVSLLSLIVLALMTVFNSTQRAFRASVTQTDVLEGGRAAVELVAQDLRQITPSGGTSDINFGAVNFFALGNDAPPQVPSLQYSPLLQSLPGISSANIQRTNVLEYFFLLARQNTKWIGIGYVVNATNSSPLYPLYRFYEETNIYASPRGLFDHFINEINTSQWTNMSHLIDGVVHLVVRPADVNGVWMTNGYTKTQLLTAKNVEFFPPQWGEVGGYFFSNTVPASVELQMGILEDRVLARASSFPALTVFPYHSTAQSNYLSQQAGRVHVFRQQVTIPNLDPTAYQ